MKFSIRPDYNKIKKLLLSDEVELHELGKTIYKSLPLDDQKSIVDELNSIEATTGNYFINIGIGIIRVHTTK